jgi:hypothetical protein
LGYSKTSYSVKALDVKRDTVQIKINNYDPQGNNIQHPINLDLFRGDSGSNDLREFEMKRLLVSVSGGETSGYMAWWLWTHKQDEYEMKFVFANTGEENEETLIFIKQCSEYFKIPVVWVEAVVNPVFGFGNTHRIVNYETAARRGEPFEDVIKKHGIPNTNMPFCSRELKLYPIKSYARSIGWEGYYTAIGIREDEADRINEKAKALRIIYPLINRQMQPMTKPKINFWWSLQPFRLSLKGYQGNCKTCWKKSDKKLYQIAKEDPLFFDFNTRMEDEFKNYVPEIRLALLRQRNESPNLPNLFFRGNRSAKDIINESKSFNGKVKDDAIVYHEYSSPTLFDDLVGGDSCEVYSECNQD